MVTFSDLRKGLTIELDGQVYQVVEYTFQKMQQRQPIMRLRIREMKTGKVIERSFTAGTKLTPAPVDHRTAQFLYRDEDLYHFMDTETYDQFPLSADALGDGAKYLTEGVSVEILSYKGQQLGVELPITVDLKIVETAPGFRGDTATAGTKPARIDTGLTVQVPLFVSEGDTVRVDTRTGLYVERVG